MEFFKPVILSIVFSILVCSILIIFGAPAQSVILGGFTVVILAMGRSIYDHYKKRIQQKISPFL
ncbi:MAG: hypothetical protein ACMUIU_15645 [bacterium]